MSILWYLYQYLNVYDTGVCTVPTPVPIAYIFSFFQSETWCCTTQSTARVISGQALGNATYCSGSHTEVTTGG